jgi:hypothetical protein
MIRTRSSSRPLSWAVRLVREVRRLDPHHEENLARVERAEQAGSDIRVDPLWLHTGIVTPVGLATELEAARQTGRDVDAVLSAKREANESR